MKLPCSSLKKSQYAPAVVIFRLLLMIAWVSNLSYSLSFLSVYALCAAAGAVCCVDNAKNQPKFTSGWMALIHICAGIFSLLVVLANLELFEPFYGLLNLFNMLTNLIAGYVLCREILVCVASRLTVREHALSAVCDRNHSTGVFWGAFLTVAAIDLVYLFFVQYPGSVSTDSIDQIKQILTGDYDNHHPYWHTFFIRIWLNLGMALLGDINAGVAAYSIWQICLMAGAFAYAVMTLYQAGVPKGWCLAVFALFALHPYHISLSITMWKDVIFGAAVLLYVTSFYRVLKGIGKKQAVNLSVFGLSTIACCVWRSNGWIAFLVSVPFYVVFLRKEHKKLLLVFLCGMAAGWFLRGPMLKMMDIPQPDFVESLSIPVQQVGRAITDGAELTEEERELLSQIIDVDSVAELYRPSSSDLLKIAIRRYNQDYLVQHKGDYLKLWIHLGLRYPMEYVRGWVDQTKGYWNGGYAVGALYDDVMANDFGIYRSGNDNMLAVLAGKAIWFFEGVHMMEPLRSIGFQFWILAILTIAGLIHLREELLLFIPVILIILTLWIATPLFCEFRYAYAMFTALPFLTAIMLCKVSKTASDI